VLLLLGVAELERICISSTDLSRLSSDSRRSEKSFRLEVTFFNSSKITPVSEDRVGVSLLVEFRRACRRVPDSPDVGNKQRLGFVLAVPWAPEAAVRLREWGSLFTDSHKSSFSKRSRSVLYSELLSSRSSNESGAYASMMCIAQLYLATDDAEKGNRVTCQKRYLKIENKIQLFLWWVLKGVGVRESVKVDHGRAR